MSSYILIIHVSLYAFGGGSITYSLDTLVKVIVASRLITNLILTFPGRVDLALDFKIFISMKFASHSIFSLFSNKVMVFFYDFSGHFFFCTTFCFAQPLAMICFLKFYLVSFLYVLILFLYD